MEDPDYWSGCFCDPIHTRLLCREEIEKGKYLNVVPIEEILVTKLVFVFMIDFGHFGASARCGTFLCDENETEFHLICYTLHDSFRHTTENMVNMVVNHEKEFMSYYSSGNEFFSIWTPKKIYYTSNLGFGVSMWTEAWRKAGFDPHIAEGYVINDGSLNNGYRALAEKKKMSFSTQELQDVAKVDAQNAALVEKHLHCKNYKPRSYVRFNSHSNGMIEFLAGFIGK